MSEIRLTIDGKSVVVPSGTYIMEAAKKIGIKIPALCYDPELEVVAACRLCLVEIEGMKGLHTSCSTLAKDGMVVHTESEKVVEKRKEVLQLLLDSHPNDCLTCQKAGNCLLQQYAYEYDVKFREHDGAKRPQLIDTSSPYILKDNSKCILCGKCVRTCSQVSDRQVLTFAERGYNTYIAYDTDQTLETSSCISCNRCVAVCPVGALIDKRLLGKIRAWEGETKTVTCRSCEYGCEYDVRIKDGKNVAVVAKPPSNGRPLCLKGRLFTELKYLDNPEQPYRKRDGKFIETTWERALFLNDIIDKVKELDSRK